MGTSVDAPIVRHLLVYFVEVAACLDSTLLSFLDVVMF